MVNYEVIKDNRIFRRLYRRNQCIVTPYFVVYFNKNKKEKRCLGITVSKKIGNAVMRNRAKRVIRQAFFMTGNKIKTGYDFVIVARSKTVFTKSTDLYNELIYQLRINNLLEENEGE